MHILNNKFLPSLTEVFSLSVHSSSSANFGCLWSSWFPTQAKHASSILDQHDGRNVFRLTSTCYYYLLHLMHFTFFFVVFSLESLIDNESPLELESEEVNYILRTSWTPDCFVSRKVKLQKTIKTDSVINITTAYTEIFPKADTKKTTLLTHQRQV